MQNTSYSPLTAAMQCMYALQLLYIIWSFSLMHMFWCSLCVFCLVISLPLTKEDAFQQDGPKLHHRFLLEECSRLWENQTRAVQGSTALTQSIKITSPPPISHIIIISIFIIISRSIVVFVIRIVIMLNKFCFVPWKYVVCVIEFDH